MAASQDHITASTPMGATLTDGGATFRVWAPDDPRSWYARSRARVATGLLLTAPGVPMLFMGQESSPTAGGPTTRTGPSC
jgi:1,4-alpha-glucan branching enzyme